MVQAERLWGLTVVPAGIAGGTEALEVLVLQRSSSQRAHQPLPCHNWSLSLADLYPPPLEFLYKPTEIPGHIERERERETLDRHEMKE